VSAAQRSRGARGEREVVQLVRAAGWPQATRTSDGRTQRARGDIANGPAAVSFECKRTERLRIREAWAQATEDAGDHMPVVATRWDGGPWLAIVELDELLALLALKERG
jgi:Holliday junction resolvase